MRTPPAQTNPGGADERLPSRRPASEPSEGGEALVEHLVDRLARAEQELRQVRDAAAVMAAHRALLGRLVAHFADHSVASTADVVRLALPLLGDWAVIETLEGDLLERTVVATDATRAAAAAQLAGVAGTAERPSLAATRARHGGRIERLEVVPELPGAVDSVTRALDALGDGPALLVPVLLAGQLVAAVIFGRLSRDAGAYGAADERLAAELGALVALALERRGAVAAAEDAARTKSEFLTMMSHELRTPLNAIAGYAQLLEMGFRGPLNDEQRDAVGRILRGQEHLLELVDSVLTFSRLTSGRLTLDTAEVSAAGLLEIATVPLRRDFEQRGIALLVTPCEEGVRVVADHERGPQVLRHLLTNALKFTRPGGRVTVECTATGGAVRFTVTDTGCGIPAAQREAIFHPFVQVEKGHTRSADGSGLGLAIGRELAVRMGGTLAVSSEVGVGSRFVLTLPRAAHTRGDEGR